MIKKNKVKQLKIRHALFLEENKLKPNEFYYVKEDSESYTFQEKATGKLITIRR